MKIFDAKGNVLLDIVPDDTSYRYRALKTASSVTLYYSLAAHLELPAGAYIEFQGERYTLLAPESFRMQHSRLFEYTVVFESDAAKLTLWIFRDPVDGRVKFPLTARPSEHLRMLVENLNKHDTGWTAGDCVNDTEKLISYDHDTCQAALSRMADTFKTEFELDSKNKKVSLHKVEYNKDNPLPLAYGEGNGLKPGTGRANPSGDLPLGRLFVQGGTRNIDPDKYGKMLGLKRPQDTLLLPSGQAIAYDGTHFEGEEGYGKVKARTYKVSDDGLSIVNTETEDITLSEGSLDRSTDYPSHTGTVGEVTAVNAAKNLYAFTDPSIPEDLDYHACLIAGQKMQVTFQSGELAGRTFDVRYTHEADDTGHPARYFQIVPDTQDGVTMPGGTFMPVKGDSYNVYNVMLPPAYIRDDASRTGASWDMFRAAVRYLYENEDRKFTVTGEVDGMWAKKDWLNIGGRLVVGGYVKFADPQFAGEGALVRITGIKDYINRPHSPSVELSNQTAGTTVQQALRELSSREVLVEKARDEAVAYARRGWRDAVQTAGMIREALLNDFTSSVSPVTVSTMQLLAGDKSLQYYYIASPKDFTTVDSGIRYDAGGKTIHCPEGYIRHMTIAVKDISSSHKDSERPVWHVGEFTSAALDDPDKSHYLYIKAPKDGGEASYELSDTPLALDPGDGSWRFLNGILGSEWDGDRSYVPLYGFSEILPGRITADRLVSSDGESFFDMVAGAMKLKDRLEFNVNGQGELVLKGTMVQSGSGDTSALPCYRGGWGDKTEYYNGDEVTWLHDGIVSTYKYVARNPSTGHAPSDTNFWTPVATGSKGGKGDKGADYTENMLLDSAKGWDSDEYRIAIIPFGADRLAEGDRFTVTMWGVELGKGKTTVWADNSGGNVGSGATLTDRGNGIWSGKGTWQVKDGKGNTADSSSLHIFVPPSTVTGVNTRIVRVKVERGWNDSPSWTPNSSEMVGKPGAAGKGIEGIDEYYALSKDGDTAPATSAFSKNLDKVPSPTQAEPYLWSYTATRYTDGKDELTTRPIVLARWVTDGKDGNGITGTTVYFCASDSATDAPVAGWTTDVSKTGFSGQKPYLWSYQAIAFTTGAVQDTAPVVVGRWGADGSSYTENLVLESAKGWENQDYLFAEIGFGGDTLAEGEKFTATLWGASLGSGKTEFNLFSGDGMQGNGAFADSGKGYLTLKGYARSPGKAMRIYAMPSSVKGVTSRVAKMKIERGWNDNPVWSPNPMEMVGVNYTENQCLRSSEAQSADKGGLVHRYCLSKAWRMNTQYQVTIWGSLDSGEFWCFAGSDSDSGPTKHVELEQNSPGVWTGVLSVGASLSAIVGTQVPDRERMLAVYLKPDTVTGTARIDRIKVEEGVNPRPRWTPCPDEKAPQGPALVFRGQWDTAKQYYGTDIRADCVQDPADSRYYIASTDAGSPMPSTAPRPSADSDGRYWKPFGADFESVATGLLLADKANLAGFIFQDERLVSQNSYQGKPALSIDGNAGVIRLNDGDVVLSPAETKLGNYSFDGIWFKGRDNSGAEVVNISTMESRPPTTVNYNSVLPVTVARYDQRHGVLKDSYKSGTAPGLTYSWNSSGSPSATVTLRVTIPDGATEANPVKVRVGALLNNTQAQGGWVAATLEAYYVDSEGNRTETVIRGETISTRSEQPFSKPGYVEMVARYEARNSDYLFVTVPPLPVSKAADSIYMTANGSMQTYANGNYILTTPDYFLFRFGDTEIKITTDGMQGRKKGGDWHNIYR